MKMFLRKLYEEDAPKEKLHDERTALKLWYFIKLYLYVI